MSIMALRVTLTGAVSASDVEKYLILGLQKGAVLCSGGKLFISLVRDVVIN